MAKRRAAVRGTSGPADRNVGSRKATVNWPPTQMVAANTWRKRRTVESRTSSTSTMVRQPDCWAESRWLDL